MRVGIVCGGTRGDVEPYVALASALRAAGHEVAMAASVDAGQLVAAADAHFVPLDFDVQALVRESGGMVAGAGRRRAGFPGWKEMMARASGTIGDGIKALAKRSDVLVAGLGMDDHALAVAQAYEVPLVTAYFVPLAATADFPHPLLSRARLRPRPLAGPVNRATHRLAESVYWRDKQPQVNALRRSLGLPPASASVIATGERLGLTTLHHFSTTLVPRPRDWGPHQVITGYWRLPAEARRRLGEAEPPPDLVAWLAAGPAPVFLSLGSMMMAEPRRLVDLAVGAARRTGSRVLIGSGWTDLSGVADQLPAQVHAVGAVDHDWLFPRCAAIVHHGGSGTTAASLTAGRPNWVYSLFFDQPFWGSRVTRLGAGGHTYLVDLDLDRLGRALRHLARPEVRERAAACGERLRAEDGLGRAIEVLADVARRGDAPAQCP
ncbi:glycosyltransferase [Phytohabitans aurantiacus]|uniref:glycosyltransferase n=1 Tax=Phytohabitans aurantiacus TaxID=3016789 RepID=UPI0024907E91|nr:glycosyltransferase [Phytohabitans aurantiacus]